MICDYNYDSFILINRNQKVTQINQDKEFFSVETHNDIIYSCYFSSNGKIEDFQILINRLENVLRHRRKKSLVTGDFNAKTPVF